MSKLEESKLFNTLVGGMQERGVYTDLETGISHNVIFWKHSDFPNAHLYISTSLTTLMQLETVIESVILAEKLKEIQTKEAAQEAAGRDGFESA